MYKSDQPQTDEEMAEATAFMAKAFGLVVPTYAKATQYYSSLLQSLNWIARMTQPTLVTAVSILASATHKPPVKAIKGLKQSLRYVAGKQNDGLSYTRRREYAHDEWPRQIYDCDSSFHDHLEAGKPQGGVAGCLDGGAATYFCSNRPSRVPTCTAHAERYFSAQAAKQIVYEPQLAIELQFDMPVPLLNMDSTAVITASAPEVRRFSQRMKHHLLDERCLTQCVEAGLIEVKYKSTTDIAAGAMAKALPSVTLQRHALTLERGMAP